MKTKICRVKGCSRIFYSREYCRRHYEKWWKYGNPLIGRTHNGEGAKNIPLHCYKRDAKRRGLSWSISDNHAFYLFQTDCNYCGTLPSNIVESGGIKYMYNGIDRKNNNKGYTYKNSVSCCWKCNRMKAASSDKEFLVHMKKIYDYCNHGVKI